MQADHSGQSADLLFLRTFITSILIHVYIHVVEVSSSEECKLTTPSNQLLCYFCGVAGSRYDSFIDLRAHLFDKHNKETRRLCFRQKTDTIFGRNFP
jgi:hypothetical protein